MSVDDFVDTDTPSDATSLNCCIVVDLSSNALSKHPSESAVCDPSTVSNKSLPTAGLVTDDYGISHTTAVS
jgi:hypothetical protein